MLKFTVIIVFLVCSFMGISYARTAMPVPIVEKSHAEPQTMRYFLSSLSSMKNKQVEKVIGRKLVFKEKIALQLLRWKKFGPDPIAGKQSHKGRTSKIMGIIALAGLLLFPLATLVCGVLAIVYGAQAKKENPNDKDAQLGIILGIVSLGLFLLVIAIVIAFIAAWGSWG